MRLLRPAPVTLLFTVALALACGSGDDDEEEGNNEVGGTGEATISSDVIEHIIRPGETTEQTWTVSWAGGERPDDVFLKLWPIRRVDSFGADLWSEWVHGEAYTLTFTGGHRYVYEPIVPAVSQYQAASTGTPTLEGEMRIQVFGGPADIVYSPIDAMSMGVGEVRPFDVFPATALAYDPLSTQDKRHWSDDPVNFSIADSSVATVDADGIITAVAVGETMLTATAGDASVDVPLTVDDTPLGPPPNGAIKVTDHALVPYNVDHGIADGPVETKAALDERGWPMLVASSEPAARTGVVGQPEFFSGSPVLLASWTGTGFGYEVLDVLQKPRFPGIEVDSDGHEYVVVHDSREHMLEVWDRPGDTLKGGWRSRRLEFPLSDGATTVDDSGWGREYLDHNPVAFLPREDGGMWLAWAAAVEQGTELGNCPLVIELAAITPDSLEIEPVATVYQGSDIAVNIDCDDYFDINGRPNRLGLLPASFGSAFPTVVSLGFSLEGESGLIYWRWSPDGWAGEDIPVDNPTFDLVWNDIAVAKPAESADDIVLVESGGPVNYAYRGPGEDALYLGSCAPEYGQNELPEPGADPLTDPGPSWRYYLGHDSDAERLTLFGNQGEGAWVSTTWLFTTPIPAWPAEGDPESSGRPLIDEFGTVRVPNDLFVGDGGERYLHTGQFVYEIAGADEPMFTHDPLSTEGLYLGGNSQAWAHDGLLHMMSGRENFSGLWGHYSWDGASWATVNEVPLGHEVMESIPTADGGLWALAKDGGAVWVPPTASSTPVSVAAGTFGSSITDGGAVARDDGGLIYVDAYSGGDVTVVGPDGSVEATYDNALTDTLADRVIGTATGRLLMPAQTDWLDDSTQVLFSSDDEGGSWQTIDIAGYRISEYPHLLQLSDGDVALVSTMDHDVFGHQAGIIYSNDDGETWGEPQWVRPQGSRVQRVSAVAEDVDGDILVVMQEAGGMHIPQGFDYMPRLWFDIPGDTLVEVTR